MSATSLPYRRNVGAVLFNRDGRVLVFAFDAASVPEADLDGAASTLNDAATALASCGCR